MKKTGRLTLVFLLAATILLALSGCEDAEEAVKVGVATPQTESAVKTEKPDSSPAQTEFRVGDALDAGGLHIVYAASGDYTSKNEYIQPKDGNKFIFIKLNCENTSDSDEGISFYDFTCYADGYACDANYDMDDMLSATLSPGRSETGKILFEVPKNAAKVEIEYENNLFTEQKYTFLFEGDKDSGFESAAVTASPDAFSVGDVVKTGNFTISYLSSEEYDSSNQFLQPKDGYKYIDCKFEFENVSNSDQNVSSGDFTCYADGMSCDAFYGLDDDLSASLSPGRKAAGTVAFEVPEDAKVVEVEYLTNVWTSDRVVFTYEP